MSNTATVQGMLYRTLGSTGEKVSAIGIDGRHIGLNGVDEQLSIRIIRTGVLRLFRSPLTFERSGEMGTPEAALIRLEAVGAWGIPRTQEI